MEENVQNGVPLGPCKGHQVGLMSSSSFLAVIVSQTLTEFAVQEVQKCHRVSQPANQS